MGWIRTREIRYGYNTSTGWIFREFPNYINKIKENGQKDLHINYIPYSPDFFSWIGGRDNPNAEFIPPNAALLLSSRGGEIIFGFVVRG